MSSDKQYTCVLHTEPFHMIKRLINLFLWNMFSAIIFTTNNFPWKWQIDVFSRGTSLLLSCVMKKYDMKNIRYSIINTTLQCKLCYDVVDYQLFSNCENINCAYRVWRFIPFPLTFLRSDKWILEKACWEQKKKSEQSDDKQTLVFEFDFHTATNHFNDTW